MKADKAPCWHCRRMFEPWTNEKYCSPACQTAAMREDEEPAATHVVLTVAVAEHEADDPAWRVQHASETISLVLAYFSADAAGNPVRAADGTFEVHAPSRATLGTLREMLEQHEGLTIVSEAESPGTGLIAAVER